MKFTARPGFEEDDHTQQVHSLLLLKNLKKILGWMSLKLKLANTLKKSKIG
jgi:hypothetical protein